MRAVALGSMACFAVLCIAGWSLSAKSANKVIASPSPTAPRPLSSALFIRAISQVKKVRLKAPPPSPRVLSSLQANPNPLPSSNRRASLSLPLSLSHPASPSLQVSPNPPPKRKTIGTTKAGNGTNLTPETGVTKKMTQATVLQSLQLPLLHRQSRRQVLLRQVLPSRLQAARSRLPKRKKMTIGITMRTFLSKSS